MDNVIASYQQNGFHIARGLLPGADVEATLASLKHHFDNQLRHLGLAPPDSLYDSMQQLFHADIDRYKKTAGSLWRKLSVYSLCHHRAIQDFVRTHFGWRDIVIPGGQVVHIQTERLKIPGGYFGLVPHQDFPSVQGSLDGFVVWIPLVDVDENRYPLEVIPGSHKRGLLPSIENPDSTWEVQPQCYDDTAFVPALCHAGDVIFMSNFTVHRSSTQGDDRLRLACSTRYDNGDEPSFIARGYPSAYVRTVQREQLFDIDFSAQKKSPVPPLPTPG